MKNIFILLTLIGLVSVARFSPAQSANDSTENELYKAYGTLLRIPLSSAAFPDTARSNGHTYEGKTYPAAPHYADNTVLVFIPKNFKTKPQTDFVIHFHGWYNNADSSLKQYRLIEQFVQAGKNAILVVPQGAKNVPDSFGGKLETTNGFTAFMEELTRALSDREVITSKKVGNIVLSGHSGAYRVMGYILMRGGLTANIKEVYMFDGLYGELEKFAFWLSRYNGRLINIYTKEGGTKENSEKLVEDLAGWGIPFKAVEEKNISLKELEKPGSWMIYSSLGHNQVIHINNQFYMYLLTSGNLK